MFIASFDSGLEVDVFVNTKGEDSSCVCHSFQLLAAFSHPELRGAKGDEYLMYVRMLRMYA